MTPVQLPIVNQQPVEEVDHGPGLSLDVVEVYHTLQGEGPFMGWPAVFVRTAGCTLCCPLCDTNYTEGRERVETSSLVSLVRGITNTNTKLVVITGGEPFRQTIGPFVRLLVDCGYKVQIETNGTVYDESMKCVSYNPNVTIVCSPKTRIHPALRPHIQVYKYVLDSEHVGQDGLPSAVLGLTRPPDRPDASFLGRVYIQPADHDNPEMTARNIDAAVRVCKEFGYILSLQTHKVARIP